MTKSLILPAAAAGITVVLITLLLGAPQAEAHAVQVGSTPSPNEQLAEPPDQVTINFSEPIEPSVTTVQLWNTAPEEIPIADPQFPDDKTLTVAMPEDMPPGIYTVIWRNLSTVDGHTWSGSFPFIVLGPGGEVPEGAVPASLQEASEPPADQPSTLESVARWVVLLGTAVMLGGTAYVLFVGSPAAGVLGQSSRQTLQELSRTIVLVTGAIAVFLVVQGSFVQLLLQADDLGGLGKADELLIDTRFGHYLIARQVLLAIALVGIALAWRAGKSARALAPLGLLLAASVGVLFTQSLVSHAASADGAFWKVSADLLHLLAASLWVGGLIHIGLAMPRWLDELRGVPRTLFAAESFRRFSVLAAFSVLVLMVSGVLSALAQFTSFDQLWDTTYGWSLTGKMAAMIPLLAAGGVNAFFLQPRIVETAARLQGGATADDGGTPGAGLQRLLANTVRIEAVLGIAVLVAVAVLIQLQPPRAIAEAEALSSEQPAATADEGDEESYLEAAQAGGLVISLEIEPLQVGQNQFEVGLGSEFGNIGEVLLVRLDFRHPDAGQSSLELPLMGSASYRAEGSNLSLPGDWTVDVTIRRRGEDEDVRATFDVPVSGGESAEAAPDEDGTIWDWPFDGARSTGAIAALAVGAVGLAGVTGWQLRNIRRRL